MYRKTIFAWTLLSLTCFAFCHAQFLNRSDTFADTPFAEQSKVTVLPAIMEFQLLDTEPVPLNYEVVRDALRYPAEVYDAGFEGMVQLRVLVNEAGKALQYVIVSSPHTLLSDACMEQAHALRFQPATKKGRQVASWTTTPFQFRIRK